MNRRRQALQLCLDPAVVVVVQIVDQFLLEMLHGLKLLQIKQLVLEQSKEIFNHGVVQAVSFPTHALSDALFPVQPLDHIVGADACPMFTGKIAVGQRLLNAVLNLSGSLQYPTLENPAQ